MGLLCVQCGPGGLNDAEVARRLEQYGPNKLPESNINPFLRFLGYMWNPLSWAMEVAAIIAIALLDFADFGVIIGLLLCNATIRCAPLLKRSLPARHKFQLSHPLPCETLTLSRSAVTGRRLTQTRQSRP